MHEYQTKLIELAVARKILRFGQFTLKSGRISPYFFNAGGFDDGHAMRVLSNSYASSIAASELNFNMLFGPAYKGIPLATGIAMAWDEKYQQSLPYAYNRKEAKDHGEGGQLVGAPLSGRVLIVDDVISAGTSVRESVSWIREAGAEVAGVAIALDRQERGQGALSAAQEVAAEFGFPVVPVISLADLLTWLETAGLKVDIAAIKDYRERYGV
ncbi:MAG: orotate phosphoribosyltransferase [Proteobacteria bacterium]|nr:orotate phosphoribosyltransferase [Pseudomonadota bacterium]